MLCTSTVHQRRIAAKQNSDPGDASAAVPEKGGEDHGLEAGTHADLWSL